MRQPGGHGVVARFAMLLLVVPACAETSRVIVTHLGAGRGSVISQICDTTGVLNPPCQADGFISCPPPATPLVPSDTPAVPEQRPRCAANVDRMHALKALPESSSDRFASFGGANTSCGETPDSCDVDRSAGPNNEVFVSFARAPVSDASFDLHIQVSGDGTVENLRPAAEGCSLECSGYRFGRIVTISATPPEATRLGTTVQWTGCYVVRESFASSLLDAPAAISWCTVVMDQTKTVSATFVPESSSPLPQSAPSSSPVP